MQTTTFPRTPARIARTHKAIERATAWLDGLIEGHAVLVGERRNRVTLAKVMTRTELERHLIRRATATTNGERLKLIEIADAVRATPPHRAPVVIATVEGRVILQWLEAA